jgi:hypothetical protein
VGRADQPCGILRDCMPDRREGRLKIQSELRGDAQSQAEMSWPPGRGSGSNKTVGPYLPWALES